MPTSIVNLGAEDPNNEALLLVEAQGWKVDPLPPDTRRFFFSALSHKQPPSPEDLSESVEAVARSLRRAHVSNALLSPLLPSWFFAPLEAALIEGSIEPFHDSALGKLLETGRGGIRGDVPAPKPKGARIYKLFGTEVSSAETENDVVLAPLAAVARVRLLKEDYVLRDTADAVERVHYAAEELRRILLRHAETSPIFVWLDLHPALTSLFGAEAYQ
ncbi:hypothetical protein [Sabulicella glaciei]|uniref:Uncharacterized protein n=1 Tax=Sabulicella glaciei TaxID=2984948 RepID=A0ABT3P1Y7_9PROT|nr:hypothetical protein [Roseococcus sp. MDT2-1-1]MCW8088421.1 hypothetical protein [Roseococcus sp. MDT2-1-1]